MTLNKHETLSDLLASPDAGTLVARIARARAIQAAVLRIISDSGKYPRALDGFPQRHDWKNATDCDVYQWNLRLHTWRQRLPLATRLELEDEAL